jgi:predicted MPP superfamily phosphohydrolase
MNRIVYMLLVLAYCLLTDETATTLVVIPDSQYLTAYHKAIAEEQMQWVCSCKEQLNFEYVIHVGDIVEHGDVEEEWQTAKFCAECMKKKGLPFSIAAGNHDISSSTYYNNLSIRVDSYDYLNKYFNDADRYNKYDPNNIENHYVLWDSALDSRLKFIIVTLQFNANETLIQWASSVLEQHRDRMAIVASHWIQHDCSASMSSRMRKLAYNNCNVFMMLSGHLFHCGGENMMSMRNACGGYVYSIVQDYQNRHLGGSGTLRYYTFRSLDDGGVFVCANTYNIYSKEFELDSNSSFSFTSRIEDAGVVRYGCDTKSNNTARTYAFSTPTATCTSSYTHSGILLTTLMSYMIFILAVFVLTYKKTIDK